MSIDINAILASDVFLSCILLLVLSMLGLRLFPFNLSSLQKVSLRNIWSEITLGPRSQNQMERAISAFYQYAELSFLEIECMQKRYAKIGRAHKRIGYELGYPAKLERLAEVTKTNARITSAIATLALEDIGLGPSVLGGASINDLRDAREALRHLIRDWSVEGVRERAVVLEPILEVLSRVEPGRRKSLKVLVPGSGLGRLAWEISELGFISHSNELSPFMNICFRLLISPKSTHTPLQHTVHPYANWFSHQRSNTSLFRPISFPDVLPRLSSTFHHLPTDFLHLGPTCLYDYVITQFFIDTSFNVISTLEQIHRLLRPGGKWINLGPLLWRAGAQAALELSLGEVLALAGKVGFDVDEATRRTVECEYTADKEAMMSWIYKAEFWIAEKRIN